MPLFFFDLAAPGSLERDEVGVEFEHLEAAYLDGCKAALEISMEMLRDRRDPNGTAFLVRDAQGRRLMEIPFAEMLRPRPPGRPASAPIDVRHALEQTLARNRTLQADLRTCVAQAQATLVQTRALLQASRAR